MCGIAGYLNPEGHPPATQEEILMRMLSIIRHRGPDGAGILTSPLAALGAVRLSIVDLEHGQQPIGNETSDVFVVFNGEIFNHRELRRELENRGHRFATHADTEVLVHLYEEHGVDFLRHLNGQFAIALWDVKKEQLLLARDRPGIRPLFYTRVGKQLIFASEIKSVLCYPGVKRAFHGEGLDQILTFWTTIGKTTLFEGIDELPPAHYMLIRRDGEPRIQRYWDYDFPGSSSPEHADFALQKEKLDAVLSEAVRLQLRADVPVGVYLSGGLDSSVLSALVSRCTTDKFKTFSVEFEDATLDESRFQHAVAARYGTEHHAVRCSPRDVGTVFPEVIWHTEKPVFRTAPAPLYLLSKLVRDHGIKVVLTGEGADEMLWGYDTFKEQKIREFWRRRPESQMRPLLLKRLFPYLSHYSNNRYYQLIRMFYQTDLMSEDASGYSHLPRWRNNAALKSFYSTDFRASLGTVSPRDTLDSLLPGHFDRWQSLERNQYLETMTLLPGYLLSSQGDRMSMAHSVEGRVPFLDHHVIDACARIPGGHKMRVLRDKHLLRETFREQLPPEIFTRYKRAYMAPDAVSFFSPGAPEYVEELTSDAAIKHSGIFDAKAVSAHKKKLAQIPPASLTYRDNMAAVVLISTQLFHHLYLDRFMEQREVPTIRLDKHVTLSRPGTAATP